MNVGDKLVCIKQDTIDNMVAYEVCKEYKICDIYEDGTVFLETYIRGDLYNDLYFEGKFLDGEKFYVWDYFCTLTEYRNKKLKTIL